MPIRVKINLKRLNEELSAENIIKARKAMANQAHQEMERYVPSSSKGNQENGSTLRGESKVSEDGSTVVYNVPYAKAQFYGFITNRYGGPFRIHNYTTPGTSRRWDLRLKGNDDAMARAKKALIGGMLWLKH